MEVSASILSVKEEESVHTFYRLEIAKIDYFHIDVMDGEFVERNSQEEMKKYADNLKNITNIPLDVHLMVEDVKKYVDIFSPNEPRCITFHYEAVKDKTKIMDVINYIKQYSKVGLSIKPETKIEEIYDFLPYVHNILIMTVEPGKGGQELIPETIEKIKTLKKYIEENNLETEIEADGGINLSNINELKNAGVDIAVVGTALIGAKDYKYMVNKLKE